MADQPRREGPDRRTVRAFVIPVSVGVVGAVGGVLQLAPQALGIETITPEELAQRLAAHLT